MPDRGLFFRNTALDHLFRNFFSPAPTVGNVPSAGIGYNLILARPMPPPLRWESIFHVGPFRPSNQLFEHQA
jgi:hypothetical protein